jgi:hypothetical protein
MAGERKRAEDGAKGGRTKCVSVMRENSEWNQVVPRTGRSHRQ